jgi:hypothetical protein
MVSRGYVVTWFSLRSIKESDDPMHKRYQVSWNKLTCMQKKITVMAACKLNHCNVMAARGSAREQ